MMSSVKEPDNNYDYLDDGKGRINMDTEEVKNEVFICIL